MLLSHLFTASSLTTPHWLSRSTSNMASNEAELARRQAAADAYLQYQRTQQIINNMNSSVNTN